MDLAAARRLVRIIRAPAPIVAAGSGGFRLDDAAVDALAERLLEGGGGPAGPLNSAAALVAAVEQWARRALDGMVAAGVPAARLEPLLRGALVESRLREADPDASVFSAVRRAHETLEAAGAVPAELAEPVARAVASADARGLVLLLAPALCGLDGRDLVGRLNLSLPREPQAVSPDWFGAHARADRPTQYWLYGAPRGSGLFLVLASRRCAWARCADCALHRLGFRDGVGSPELVAQMEHVAADSLTGPERAEVSEVFLSNNGSVLDAGSFPEPALLYGCTRLARLLPALERVVLETRAEFVTDDALRRVQAALNEGEREVTVDLAVGVEIFDSSLRNRRFHKGLGNGGLRRLIETAAAANAGLWLYFMYKPLPGMDDVAARGDIERAAAWLDTMAARTGVPITLYLNPTYVPAGTELHEAFLAGAYTPPRLADVKRCVAALRRDHIRVRVGLTDEGLAVPGGGFVAPGEEALVAELRRFNRLQTFAV